MKLICVDDEPLAVEYTLKQCARIPEICDIRGFTEPQAALDWVASHPVDLALLDIHMPELNGIELASRIRKRSPGTAILFLSGSKDHAFDAYAVHPVGYLLKPVPLEKLADEIRYVSQMKPVRREAHIRITTFGYFDVYVDGQAVSFRLARSKEILAFLVDKHGAGITRPELFAGVCVGSPV